MFQPLFETPRTVTVAEVIALWLSHTSRHQDPASLANRLRILNEFRDRFGSQAAETISPLVVSSWVYSHDSWRSDWTIHRVILTLKVPFNWAVKVALIGKNPLVSLSHPKGEPIRPVSEVEFRSLLRSSPAVFRRVLIFLALTGSRPCELRIVRWSDLDLDRGAIVLRKHKTARSLKTPRPRVIILNDCCVRLLTWIRKRQEGEFVFLNSKGEPWTKNALNLRVRALRLKNGIAEDAKLYGLRHRFGTRHAAKGTPLKILAELMGHSTTRMTEHYVHLSGNVDHLRRYLD